MRAARRSKSHVLHVHLPDDHFSIWIDGVNRAVRRAHPHARAHPGERDHVATYMKASNLADENRTGGS
jgi:hypothetical protein